jgi:translation initiation factor IF-2
MAARRRATAEEARVAAQGGPQAGARGPGPGGARPDDRRGPPQQGAAQPGMAQPGPGTGPGREADRKDKLKARPGGKGAAPAPAARGRVEMDGDDLAHARRRRRPKPAKQISKSISPQAKAIKRRIEVDGTITVSNLAHALSVKAGAVIKTLLGMGKPVTVNEPLDFDTAQLVAAEYQFEVVNASFQEDEHLIDLEEEDTDLEPRPPVVWRGGWHHPAHRRLPGRAQRPAHHLHRHPGPRGLYGHARPRRPVHRHRRPGRRRR